MPPPSLLKRSSGGRRTDVWYLEIGRLRVACRCSLWSRSKIIGLLGHNTFATNPRIGSPTKEGGVRVSLRRRRCKCGECGRKTSKPTHVYEYGDDDRIRIVCPDCMAQYPDGRCADGGPARTRSEAINGRKPQTPSSSTVPPLEGATALVRHHLHTHRRWRSKSL